MVELDDVLDSTKINIEKYLSGAGLLEKGTIIYPSTFLYTKVWVLPIAKDMFLLSMKKMFVCSIILHFTAMPYYLKNPEQQTKNLGWENCLL